MKICPQCQEPKELSEFKHENGHIRNNVCKICIGKRYRTKLRLDMLNAFNRRCACCGEANPNFLTLDHIQNDGNKHREELNCQQIIADARRQGFPKDRYQLLCFNCNCAREAYGECPHKSGKTAEEAYLELIETQIVFGKSNQNYKTEKNLDGLSKARGVLKDVRKEENMQKIKEMLLQLTPEQLRELI